MGDTEKKTSKHHLGRQSSFGFLLQLLARRMDSLMKSRLEEVGIDLKTFANLRLLRERDGVRQKELGRLLEFPEYHTSRSVDALVEAELVERRPDPDSRRSVLVYLTRKGKAKAAKLPAIVEGVNREFLSELATAEREQLVGLMQKVAGIREGGDPAL